MKKISLLIVFVFIIGLTWGLAFSSEVVTDCCTSCWNYCDCTNGFEGSYGCKTVACPSDNCSGVGIKCCWPKYFPNP